MGAIDMFGTEEQRARWLPPMARLEAIGAFGAHRAGPRVGRQRPGDPGAARAGGYALSGANALDRQRHIART